MSVEKRNVNSSNDTLDAISEPFTKILTCPGCTSAAAGGSPGGDVLEVVVDTASGAVVEVDDVVDVVVDGVELDETVVTVVDTAGWLVDGDVVYGEGASVDETVGEVDTTEVVVELDETVDDVVCGGVDVEVELDDVATDG